MRDILRVNMEQETAWRSALPQAWALLGGRGLTAGVLLAEVDPLCDPLGEENKLVVAAGLLAGGVSSSNRVSVGAKSPLTGGIKEANAGGVAALYLARLGLRAIIVEGRPKRKGIYCLVVRPGAAEILPAAELEGREIGAVVKELRARFGLAAAIMAIGSAGERRLSAAGIAATDADGQPTRFAARGGLGAVMAAKGLKAIVLLPGPEKPAARDAPRWAQAARDFHTLLRSHPYTANIFPLYGTPATLETINRLGGLPIRNFRLGRSAEAEAIGGKRVYELIRERGGQGKTTHACMPGCLVKCSNVFPDEKGEVVCTPLEYENLVFLGSNLGLYNLDKIAALNRLCNELGIDSIEVGNAIAVAVEAGLLPFGDFEAARELILQIRKNTLLGRVLGQGAAVAGRVFGVDRIPAVKGQAIPGYDPRALKGYGVTYLTSPMGADHTAGGSLYSKIDHRDPKGKVEHSREMQLQCALMDALGLCLFTRPVYQSDPEPVAQLVAARFGLAPKVEHLHGLAKEVLKMELAFNQAASAPLYERLPEFYCREPLPPTDAVWDVPAQEIERIWADLAK